MTRLLLLLLLLFPLTFALISQYGFNLAPCQLCLLQRLPYYAAGFIVLLGVLNAAPLRILVLTTIIGCLIAGTVAVFHMGVEYKFWEGTAKCGGQKMTHSIEELKAQLWAAPTVKCDEPAFVFLGLSMAGWGAVYALFASVFALWLGRKKYD